MENRLLSYIKKVGVGARGSKHLERSEAYGAMNAILDGGFDPVTFGSFCMALRMKGETADELAGLADAMNARMVQAKTGKIIPNLLNGGGAFNGKDHTLNINVPASIVAAASGAKILLQGSEGIPAKCGMTAYHVLNALRIKTDCGVDECESSLQNIGVAYLHQPVSHPSVYALANARKQIGKRTFFNTIEPMMNPLRASCHLGGFFHRTYAELSCEAIARSSLGFARAVFVASVEGSDELRPTRSLAAEWNGNEIKTYYIEPSDFGLNASQDDIEAKASGPDDLAKQSADRILAFFDGTAPAGYANLVLLNAAFRLYVSGASASIEDGLKLCVEAHENGKGHSLLDAWRGR